MIEDFELVPCPEECEVSYPHVHTVDEDGDHIDPVIEDVDLVEDYRRAAEWMRN